MGKKAIANRKAAAVEAVLEALAAREDGAERASAFMEETVRPILSSFGPYSRWAIVEDVIGRGGLAPDEIEALRVKGH